MRYGGSHAYRITVRITDVFVFEQLEYSCSQQHTDTRCEKSPFEVFRMSGVSQQSAYQRGEGRAYIHTHIEDGESRVFTVIVFPVKPSDHGRNVWLEESVTQNKQSQSAEHQIFCQFCLLVITGTQKQKELSESHCQCTGYDGATVTPVAVGNVAADERCQINQSGVTSIYL